MGGHSRIPHKLKQATKNMYFYNFKANNLVVLLREFFLNNLKNIRLLLK